MSDLYLKRTSPTGKVVITHHFVWDLARFLAYQQRQERELAEKGKDSCTITVATRDEYRDFTWPKGRSK